jgi:hypothetical protein
MHGAGSPECRALRCRTCKGRRLPFLQLCAICRDRGNAASARYYQAQREAGTKKDSIYLAQRGWSVTMTSTRCTRCAAWWPSRRAATCWSPGPRCWWAPGQVRQLPCAARARELGDNSWARAASEGAWGCASSASSREGAAWPGRVRVLGREGSPGVAFHGGAPHGSDVIYITSM